MKTNVRSILLATAVVACFTVGAANAQTKMSGDTSKMSKSKMNHGKMTKMSNKKTSHSKMSKMSDSKMSHGKMKKDSSKM